MGPIDYSILTLASLLKKKYNISDQLEDEIRSLSSMSADAILPENIYETSSINENIAQKKELKKSNQKRLHNIKLLGDKWDLQTKE
jgi:hypothetical protein